jgi:alpha-beta hydrolase superfamily lysophospholipase
VRRLALALVFCFCAGCAGGFYVRKPRPEVVVADSIDHSEGTFDGAGYVKIFEQWWRPARRHPRAVVVLLHGLKDHSTRAAELAERLAEKDIAVYAFDLRGHGSSGGRRGYVETFDEYDVDLEKFVAEVRDWEPNERLFIFAQGLGGLIAVDDLLKKRVQVDGLILSGADLRFDMNGVKRAAVNLAGTIVPLLASFEIDEARLCRDPAAAKSRDADPLIVEGAGPARTEREVLNEMDFVAEHAAELNVPLLVLHGGADKISDAAGSKRLFEMAASLDKSLKIYDGLYHDLLHEPEKEQVMRDVTAWIEERIR